MDAGASGDSGDDLSEKPRYVVRYYHVFNAQQCEGISPPDAQAPKEEAERFEPLEKDEQIVASYQDPPAIERGGGSAFYCPDINTVPMPPSARFVDRESYYATLFHELAHSTGHPRRLNREAFRVQPGRQPGSVKPTAPFGSLTYSREELVAEMGSAFLAATAGISPPTIEQSAAYIDGWRKKLKADKQLVIQAAGAGQRAADHILGQAFESSVKTTTPPPAPQAPGQAVGAPRSQRAAVVG